MKTEKWWVDAKNPGIVRFNNDPTTGILVGLRWRSNLVAAAPELLEALKWILPLAKSYLRQAPGDPDNAKLESAEYAIAKAEGRS